ncbi:hypothetical protein HID58_000211 [Brassica napus]|uniref:AB hydrolase-1 domain-containing protein n=1 Tax=Brassica napus TaxID=3708 RepID=A0ABQ8EFW6_BRANA|nr:hypothetical protein HID58_000211 [Brassica napus]
MVNWVEAQKPLLNGLMKMAGVIPYTLEIEPGTKMNFWVPKETLKKKSRTGKPAKPDKPIKPVVLLIHGFAAEGIVTWQFQVGALSKKYSVYIPDLLFFGGSSSDNSDRSPAFQANCLVKGLRILGVDKFVPVGFSYGGMVAFKIAEAYPEMVRAMVVSGSILAMTDSISESSLNRLGFSSSKELLLPTSVKELKALFTIAVHKPLWFPKRLFKDFLEVMFNNRKERAELLEAVEVSNKDVTIPHFPWKIHLLWGESDQIFDFELAKNMKSELGENATIESIKKAGHLVQLERPCVYNRRLKKFSMCMIVKSTGTVPYTVETEPGTNIHFWLPKKTGDKPAVLLIHGFAGDGVMTWALQVRSLSKRYSVYIPDLLFFGKSYTDKPDRSPEFQAECLVKAMRILGVKTFVPVGFSYGGVVAFKIAELHGDMVKALVVSGSPPVMTDSNVNRFGFSSISDVLLPKTVNELKFLLSVAMHKRIWLPSWPLKDYLKTMFTNRKERAELLEALVLSDGNTFPSFPQKIHLLWGENDQFFSHEFAKDLRIKLGEMTSMEIIKNGGHLVQLERPFVYNKLLNKFLASVENL